MSLLRKDPAPPPSSEERELLERLIVAERHISDLRAREARLLEAVRWACTSARGLGMTEVAELLEALLEPVPPPTVVPVVRDSDQPTQDTAIVAVPRTPRKP